MAAEFGRQAGCLAFETNQSALAQRYFLAALRAAHVSRDRALGANILGFMSNQAANSPNPRDAVLLAESALSGARDLTPAVEASTWARLARGAAYAGDAETWQRSQDRAFDLLSRSVPENEPPSIPASYASEPRTRLGSPPPALARDLLSTPAQPRVKQPS